MVPGPLILRAPSRAAAVELPRRLASTGRALAGLYPFKLADLARAVAEPALLGSGLRPWDGGHGALLAARLLEEEGGLRLPPDAPRAPVARALARTLAELRRAAVPPDFLTRSAERVGATPEDRERLRALGRLYAGHHQAVEGRFADSAALMRAALGRLDEARWLDGATVLVLDDLELDATEKGFLAGLARRVPVRRLDSRRPDGLAPGSFAAWAGRHGVATVTWSETALAPIAPPAPPPSLQRVQQAIFDPPAGPAVRDEGVRLVTAPGEGAEARAVVRRLLGEAARGVPFEDMAVVLPRPAEYAPLFTDLLTRLGIPHRLHPSLPLWHGRTARSLLLLFRCRGLVRSAVMELLTFAPIPYEEILGPETEPRPARWDALSRELAIVSGLERWIIALRSHAEQEKEGAAKEKDAARAERRARGALDAESLLRMVELLSSTLDGLAGEAPWPEWSDRLKAVLDQWFGREKDRDAVADVISDLAGLGALGARAPWAQVERVVEARFEWERVPLDPVPTGAVHVGAMDAMAGLPFRVVAVVGLAEGGYPGVLRPDPFLLDAEREALARPAAPVTPVAPAPPAGARAPRARQLSLFDAEPAAPAPPPSPAADGDAPELATTQDRLLAERRAFQRVLAQATERLVLSYPRADARTGRERMPSLFFVAAAAAREGRPLGAADLERLVEEDDLDALALDRALDPSERDRHRVRTGGDAAVQAVAAGSPFFRQSRLATRARWSNQLTPYDGLVAFSTRDGDLEAAADVVRRLDPVSAAQPMSASRIATYARCGFLYLLQHVLKLEPIEEPEERRRLDPLERGSLFHEVAETFLRERRDRGELPVRDTPETRARLDAIAGACLDRLVATSPPRFSALWDRERERFRQGMRAWLEREAAQAGRTTPLHFELSFGLPIAEGDTSEPHLPEALSIELGDGRTLRVWGQIDRIDRRPDGTLVLRDYQTGRAPRDDGGVFRGGKQLQIPFYVLAAARMFPDAPVVEAFLDYVDGGRQVAFDPALVKGDRFRKLLRDLVDAMGQGVFAQEPTACEWCDFTSVCGPRPLLDRRRQIKIQDRRLQQFLRLRDVG